MDQTYSFVFRGQLAEASLDKVGRQRRRHFGNQDAMQLKQTLSFDLLDSDLLADAQRMSLLYTAIHSVENMVRLLVMKAMAERHGSGWWPKVPERIQKTVKTRMEEDAKFRWHGARGTTEINYSDFGDWSSIIVTNWEVFEDVVANLEWAKAVLGTLEKSRNIVMHG